MTRRLERRLEELEDGTDESTGFHRFQIGGDPDAAKTGYFEWDPRDRVYRNGDGDELPPEAAPESEFDYTIMYGDDDSGESP